jgi:broad specificity phosphatase PhoE
MLLRVAQANFHSAGSRDSELTNHGYQQATRLGLHFKSLGVTFTHLFSSHLQRAAKTAGKIREAQLALTGEEAIKQDVPDVLQLPLLMEQDFGSMEGKKFFERPSDSKTTGKEHHRQENMDTDGFVDVESKDVMGRRADTFLDEHVVPLLRDTTEPTDRVIGIVSHGIFLSTLWKRLLLRLPPRSVALSPELQAIARPSLEHLGGWSNTGYLELHMMQASSESQNAAEDMALATKPEPSSSSTGNPTEISATDQGIGKVEVPEAISRDAVIDEKSSKTPMSPPRTPSRRATSSKVIHGWTTTIQTINGKDHLQGLKRTGGGVGSSRHDASQKSIETFFKRRKVE